LCACCAVSNGDLAKNVLAFAAETARKYIPWGGERRETEQNFKGAKFFFTSPQIMTNERLRRPFFLYQGREKRPPGKLRGRRAVAEPSNQIAEEQRVEMRKCWPKARWA